MARRLDKERSIQLRKEGKSLSQIVKLVKASKGSVSSWVRNVQLTKEQLGLLDNRRLTLGGGYRQRNDGMPRKKPERTNPKIVLSIAQIRERRNKRVSTWRNKLKMRAVEYKGGKCEICGYNTCIDALEFHHKNPNEKDFTIARYPHGWDKLKKELDKCKLVCSNHHKEIHHNLRCNNNSERFIYLGDQPILPILA